MVDPNLTSAMKCENCDADLTGKKCFAWADDTYTCQPQAFSDTNGEYGDKDGPCYHPDYTDKENNRG